MNLLTLRAARPAVGEWRSASLQLPEHERERHDQRPEGRYADREQIPPRPSEHRSIFGVRVHLIQAVQSAFQGRKAAPFTVELFEQKVIQRGEISRSA